MPNEPIDNVARHTFRHVGKICCGALFLVLLVYLASGIYSIKPEQTGVVKRFGVIVADDVPPGIHYHWPWPIEMVARPNTKEIKAIELKFDKTSALGLDASGGALLTGDENLVLLTLFVQYTIDSPQKYLTVTSRPSEMLERMIEAASVRHFSQISVDDILTTGRNDIQRNLKKEVQGMSDTLGLGLRILSIQIQRVEPPKTVAHAFKDVASAREDMHKVLQRANGERNRRLPEARAKAERMLREAEAYANEAVQMAEGDAEKFLSTWKAYRKAKTVTAHRIYLETIETIMANVNKQIVNPEAEKNVRSMSPR